MKTTHSQNRIRHFVLSNYCQSCQNIKCNSLEIFSRFKTENLNEKQAAKINFFKLENISCVNYIKPKEDIFGHVIRIHYLNGKIEKPHGLFTLEEISKIWQNAKVDFVELLWTDVF